MGRGDAATGPLGALPGLTWDPRRERYFAATADAAAPPPTGGDGDSREG